MSKIIQSSGKRKSAIARATLRPGKGVVRINQVVLDQYTPQYNRLRISEPIMLAGSKAAKIDIDVSVHGGGITTQSDAIRLAIARGLVSYIDDSQIKNVFLSYDRQLLVADVRIKETHKPNSHGKARAKRQKSYR